MSLLVILSLSPLLIYLIHAMSIKVVKRQSPQLTAIFSILIGNIPIIWICLIYALREEMNIMEKASLIFYNLVVFNSLAYVYFHIFNMSETARRIHILIELKREGRLKRENIIKRYNAEDIIDNRLDRLLSLKQLRLKDNNYRINKHFLLVIAKIYSVWVQLLGYKRV